jgi:hypothetical protein
MVFKAMRLGEALRLTKGLSGERGELGRGCAQTLRGLRHQGVLTEETEKGPPISGRRALWKILEKITGL